MTAVRVLIISHDVVEANMAGPGIRYWELARVLARHCVVTLAVPEQSSLRGEGFFVQPYRRSDWRSLESVAGASDAILPGGTILTDFPQLAALGRPLVIDGYDPYPAENLSVAANTEGEEPAGWRQNLLNRLRQECSNGDFFLCASERQRYWWLGLLAAHGRLNPATYRADPTFRNLIDVVPFGLAPEPLQHTRQALKGVIPGIGPHDTVLLWGGGIWEWLDPLTLLRALPQVIAHRPDVRLIFPGTRHPSPAVPDMPVRQRAIDLAAEQGLLGKHVFFGDWVPYADWPNYLLEADAGVSLHLNSLETQLAFRSRVLDYIRAGLPMVVTRGDATSDLVRDHGLGSVVDFGDQAGVAEAILALLAQPRSAWRDRFSPVQALFTWERVAQPLIEFCTHPHRAADRYLFATGSGEQRAAQAFEASGEARQDLASCEQEIRRLQALVAAYERGRFMRLMRWLKEKTRFGTTAISDQPASKPPPSSRPSDLPGGTGPAHQCEVVTSHPCDVVTSHLGDQIPGFAEAMRCELDCFNSWQCMPPESYFGREVLDLGCGLGAASALFVARGAAFVWGIDPMLSQEQIKALSSLPRSRFSAGLLSQIDFGAQRFDLVHARLVTEHLIDLQGDLARVFELLKPGGRFVALHDNYYWPMGLHDHPFFESADDTFTTYRTKATPCWQAPNLCEASAEFRATIEQKCDPNIKDYVLTPENCSTCPYYRRAQLWGHLLYQEDFNEIYAGAFFKTNSGGGLNKVTPFQLRQLVIEAGFTLTTWQASRITNEPPAALLEFFTASDLQTRPILFAADKPVGSTAERRSG